MFNVDHKEKENQSGMSRSSLGRIVHDIWGCQGVRFKRVGKRGEKPTNGYINIRKIDGTPSDFAHTDTGHFLIDSIEEEVCLSKNWRAIRNGAFSLSFVRNEKWAINGQLVVTEILVTSQGQDICIEIISQGLKKSVQELLEDQRLDVPAKAVKQLATFLESSNLCQGIPYIDETLQSPLQGKVISFSSLEEPTAPCEKRMFSNACKLIAPPGQCCQSCSLLRKNERKRQKRRESRERYGSFVNERYMSVDGLNRKLDEQRRLIKNLKAKEDREQKRFEQEVLSIEERDHEDLIYMMENVVNEDSGWKSVSLREVFY